MDLELILIGLFALFGSLFFILFLTCFHKALHLPAEGEGPRPIKTPINHHADEELAQESCTSSCSRPDVDDSIFLTATTHNCPPKSTTLASCHYSSNLYFMKRLSRSLTAERSALIMPCIIREFSLAEIEAATTKFSSSSVIKHGHSGDIFQGVLDGGEAVVIKRVKCMHKSTRSHSCLKDGYVSDLDSNMLNNNISMKDYYAAEMEVYGKVLDQTFLVPVLGQCLTSQEEKFLVYEYMPFGDLASILAKARAATYSISVQNAEKQPQLCIDEGAEKEDNGITTPMNIAALDGGSGATLTWPVRMRIAREVAEALVYLHHESRPPLSHRNIQGSSILLNKDFEVKLGSLGDAQKIESGELPVYDIYCFGRLLLDLISGLDISGNGRDEAVQAWISMCFHALNTAPPAPLPNYNKEPQYINDMFTTELIDRTLVPLMQKHHLLEMTQAAQLAKLCMEPATLQKLSMKGVLHLLPSSGRMS